MIENLPNYDEYKDLIEDYTPIELKRAYRALHDKAYANFLFEMNNISLLVFLTDVRMQEKLHMYFDDMELLETNKEI